jgi:stearoyl-CoA desaturase (Delta-9 desaturase)
VKITALPALPPAHRAKSLAEYQWLQGMPFIAMHFVPFAAFWTGAKWQDWLVCAALYWIRMFGVTGAYHRYFAHRTYRTSRFFQFCLAFLAQTSMQKGALWWAAHHRNHHKHSDQDLDPHDSRRGFWYSHCGWIMDHTDATDYAKVKDLTRFPELVILNKLKITPSILLGIVVWLIWGWSGLVIGFGLSTVLLWHGTFTINSLSHMLGKPRYKTGELSKNNWVLALITMGEGWHNNHHHFMNSTRQGFYWWEIDLTYYVLKGMSWLGLVWDLREPPARVYDTTHPDRIGALPAATPELPVPAE